MKTALGTLVEMRDELGLEHEVSLEATHHGPTKLEAPVTFVEIGSKLEHWRDERAGEAVARAMMTAALSPTECRQAVGLGGPHYAPHHTEVVLRTDVGVGHILPKYVEFNEELIRFALTRTQGDIELLVLDWKGMNANQRRVSQRATSKLRIHAVRAQKILDVDRAKL